LNLRDSRSAELRKELRRQTKTLGDQALQTGGRVSQAELDEVARLARLVEIHDSAHRNRRTLVIMLGSALLIVGILAFVRVRSTQVELDLRLSGVSFTVAEGDALADGLDATSLLASRLARVELPRARQLTDSSFEASTLLLAAVPRASRPARIDVQQIMADPGTQVTVQKNDLPREYRLVLGNSEKPLSLMVDGPLSVGVENAIDASLDFTSPGEVRLYPADKSLTLDFVARDTAVRGFSSQLEVRDLSFMRVDEYADKASSVVREVSTVLSGTIYLEQLNGASRSIRVGEPLRFEASEGEIRELKLVGDQIALRFNGRVRKMEVGSHRYSRNLMPSVLDQFRARHGLSLFWGTTAYLFTLLIAGLRWWRQGS
jgi:hypothetical protein